MVLSISLSSSTYYFVIYFQFPSKWCVTWPYLSFFIKNCHFDRSLIKMPINLSRTIRSLSHRHFWTQWITCFQMIYNTIVITENKKIMVPEPIERFFLSLIPKSCDSKISKTRSNARDIWMSNTQNQKKKIFYLRLAKNYVWSVSNPWRISWPS